MRIRVLGQYTHVSIVALAAAEAAICFIALIAAALARFRTDLLAIEINEGALWPRALLFSCVMFISMFALGLYSSRQRSRGSGIMLRVVMAVGAGLAVNAVFFYLIPFLSIGRGVIALASGGAVCGVLAARLLLSYFAQEDMFKRRIVVYGSGRTAMTVANLRRRSDRRGFATIGFLQPPGEDRVVPEERMLEASAGLASLCEKNHVDEVVIAMEDRRRGFPMPELLECRLAGVDVTELPTFLERETGRVRLDVLTPSWMIFGGGFDRHPLRRLSARTLDLVASLIMVSLTAPVMLLTALAIKLEDGWRAPVFYRQVRVGLGGRNFQLLKFRSMRTDAESDGRAQWALKDDDRVTRIGQVIRKFRIDELPQMLNVLGGQMSFVGPRPERPEFVAELSGKIPYYVRRHSVKPGITGWAQLCYPYGSSERDALEKLQYDLYYIKNNSLLLDLTILVQTAEVVFMGQGAR